LISLRKQLRELQIRPKKSLGQHFVVDVDVLRRIAECANLEAEDVVLEIGAGLGSLTAPLAQRVKKVYAIEVDHRLAGALKNKFSGSERVEIVLADALKFDFTPLSRKWKRKMKVVANLPFEISSPMIFRLFQEREHFSLLVLMLQMEVAKRVVAKPGTKDYGPLSLWTQLYTQARIAFPVFPRAFHPQPKVDSAVVRFEILQKPSVEVEDEKTLHWVIRSAFNYRRKTLANAIHLGKFSHLPTEKIQKALRAAGINPISRGEVLSLEQFRDLSRALSALD
jgi:16S rRNA (adenine1518-N6/adenine1519-N6)-dimethyltransferase